MKKVVVVTGGSLGIGLACVNKFIELGHQVINLDLVEPEKDKGLYLKTDISDPKQIKNAFDTIRSKFNTVDIVVANAGTHHMANIEDTNEEMYNKIISTNITGTFFTLQEAIKIMKEKGSGRIITLGSDQSFIAKPASAAYGLTKAAISQLTKSIAIDYSPYGIIANCVAPGTITTPLYWKTIKKYCEETGKNVDDVHKTMEAAQPLGRTATPEEVADFIYYLAIEAGSFIQGATLSIDGGYTIQ